MPPHNQRRFFKVLSSEKGVSLMQLMVVLVLTMSGTLMLMQVFRTTVSNSVQAERKSQLHLTRERIFKNLSCVDTLPPELTPADPAILQKCVTDLHVPPPRLFRMKDKTGAPIIRDPQDKVGDWVYRAGCYLRRGENPKVCVAAYKIEISKEMMQEKDVNLTPLFEFPLCCDGREYIESMGSVDDPCNNDPPPTPEEPCGTNSSPGTFSVKVSTEAQLRKVFETKCARKIVLDDEINLSSPWNLSHPQLVALDGKGHSINNLEADNNQRSLLGVFYRANHQTGGLHVCNLGLRNVKVQGQEDVGALIGSFVGDLKPFQLFISNISLDGQIEGMRNTGGLVGRVEKARVSFENITSAATVSTPAVNMPAISVGGTVGTMKSVKSAASNKPTMSNISVTAPIQVKNLSSTHSSGIGGIVGEVDGPLQCTPSLSFSMAGVTYDGEITIQGPARNVGGIIGTAFRPLVNGATANGKISLTAMGENIGGVVGCWLGETAEQDGQSLTGNLNIQAPFSQNVGGIFGTFNGLNSTKGPSGTFSSSINGNICVGSAAGKIQLASGTLSAIGVTGTATGNGSVNQFESKAGCNESVFPHLKTRDPNTACALSSAEGTCEN